MSKNNFNLRDTSEVSIAAFVSTLFFFALKSGETIPYPYVSPTLGIIITTLWIFLHVNHSYDKTKVIPTFIVTLVVCTVSALMFNLIQVDQIFKVQFWGSIVLVSTWIAFPIAVIFEKLNITNPILREYIRKK